MTPAYPFAWAKTDPAQDVANRRLPLGRMRVSVTSPARYLPAAVMGCKMASSCTGDIYRPCKAYRPDPALLRIVPDEDCLTCHHNYEAQVCAIFRTRFLRALGLEDVKPPKKEVSS